MFLKINDEWALSSDEHSWIINKWKPSESKWVQKAWLSTFQNAVTSLARRRIRLSGATTLAEAIKDAEAIKTELTAALDVNIEVENEK